MPKHVDLKHARLLLSRHVSLLLALSYAGLATGQSESPGSAGQSDDRAQLDEVFVTAQKRGLEDVQDIPISIQAISADLLQKLGANDIQSIAMLAPSIALLKDGTGSYQIYMRGIFTGRAADSATQDNPLVGVYFDDSPVSFANFNPNIDTFDADHVEVLRGPQGTLYGAGSMGGNLRIVSALPDTKEFATKAEALTSWTDGGDPSYGLKAMVNLPAFDDKVGVRAVATWQEFGGFIDNALTGESNVDSSTRTSGKLAVRWLASDAFTLGASILWQQLNAQDRTYRTSPGTTTLYDDVQGEDEFTVVKGIHEPFDDTYALMNLALEYDFEWGTFVSSTSYYDREFLNPYQGFFPEFYEKLITGAVTIAVPLVDDWDVQNVVQEFRLSSTTSSHLQWVIGAYYSNQEARFADDYRTPNFEEITGLVTTGYGAPKNNLFSGVTTNELTEFALFGELNYPFTDRFAGTIGLRAFRTEQQFHQFFSGFFNGGVTEIDENPEDDEFTPKASLTYHVNDDAMIYATASQGYRLGGVNDPVPTDLCADALAELGLTEAPPTFGPDSLWNYEIGAKTSWLNRRLTMNATLFHIDWTDIQTRNVLSGCGFFFSENVGKATSDGVELEIMARPTDNLNLTFAGVYTDAVFAKDVPNLDVEKGDPLNGIPQLRLSATVDYSHPIGDRLEGYVRFDVQHVGSTNTVTSDDELPSYELGNIHVGVQAADGRWSSEVFVENMWDENAIYSRGNSSFAGEGVTEGFERPRVIGVRFNWNP